MNRRRHGVFEIRNDPPGANELDLMDVSASGFRTTHHQGLPWRVDLWLSARNLHSFHGWDAAVP